MSKSIKIISPESTSSISLPKAYDQLRLDLKALFDLTDEQMKTLNLQYWDPDDGMPESEDDSSGLTFLNNSNDYKVLYKDTDLSKSFIQVKYKVREKKKEASSPSTKDSNKQMPQPQSQPQNETVLPKKNESVNNSKIESNVLTMNLDNSRIEKLESSSTVIIKEIAQLKTELLELEGRLNRKVENTMEEIMKSIKEASASQQGMIEALKNNNSNEEVIKLIKDVNASQQQVLKESTKKSSNEEMINLIKEVLASQQALSESHNRAASSIPPPKETGKVSPITHKGINCSQCSQLNIKGNRYNCVKCKEMNLCKACFNTTQHPHLFVIIKDSSTIVKEEEIIPKEPVKDVKKKVPELNKKPADPINPTQLLQTTSPYLKFSNQEDQVTPSGAQSNQSNPSKKKIEEVNSQSQKSDPPKKYSNDNPNFTPNQNKDNNSSYVPMSSQPSQPTPIKPQEKPLSNTPTQKQPQSSAAKNEDTTKKDAKISNDDLEPPKDTTNYDLLLKEFDDLYELDYKKTDEERKDALKQFKGDFEKAFKQLNKKK